MNNIQIKKNGRGGIKFSFSMTRSEAEYLAALINYVPTRVGCYRGENATPENKAINFITEALNKHGIASATTTFSSKVHESNKKYFNITKH